MEEGNGGRGGATSLSPLLKGNISPSPEPPVPQATSTHFIPDHRPTHILNWSLGARKCATGVLIWVGNFHPFQGRPQNLISDVITFFDKTLATQD